MGRRMKLDGSLVEDSPLGKHRLPEVVCEGDENTLYVNQTLYYNLISAQRNAKKYKGDLLIVVDGEEGSGKSTFGRQVAKILDPRFTESQIAFSTEEARKMCYKYDEFRVVLLDESKADLDRKKTNSKKSKDWNDFLSESRILHKFMIVILPSIFDLDKYVAQHRGKMLLHTYKNRGEHPGYFSFYGRSGIKKLFVFGHKYRSYNVKASFTGRFLKQEVVDLARYNKMKMASVMKYNATDEDTRTPEQIEKEYIYERITWFEKHKNDSKLSVLTFCEAVGISTNTYYRWRTNGGVVGFD